jgi:hypothetical protein
MRRKDEEPRSMIVKCACPYCDDEILTSALPYCQRCNVSLRYCTKCQVAVEREAKVCPQCGGQLVWK